MTIPTLDILPVLHSGQGLPGRWRVLALEGARGPKKKALRGTRSVTDQTQRAFRLTPGAPRNISVRDGFVQIVILPTPT